MAKANKMNIGDIVIYSVVIIIGISTLYPFLYILSNAFSAPEEVLRRSVWLLPKKPSVFSFQVLLKEPAVYTAYYNTIWYTVVGTVINIVLTVMAAYVLSLRKFSLRKIISRFVVITMYVYGGFIPAYIVVCGLGLRDSRWALILPTAISAYNLIVARSYFQSLPEELSESATIDGANDITILLKIIVPVSKPIIAVLVIFYGVFHWNEYFNPLIYISSKDLKPIQLYISALVDRTMLVEDTSGTTGAQSTFIYEALRFSSIVVAVLPITVIYPFVQKYFIKGLMIGAVKG